MEYIHEITADAATRIEGSVYWPDMRAMKQAVPSTLGQTWDFPSLYPTVDFAF